MSDTAKAFYIVLGLALVAGMILAVWLIGSERLATLALILVIALAVAGVIAASALPIRAYRKRDLTGETIHRYHDGTKTVIKETRVIDGRQTAPEVKLLQLPQAQGSGALFPELLRASYRAGMLGAGQDPTDVVDGKRPIHRLGEIDANGWGGRIDP